MASRVATRTHASFTSADAMTKAAQSRMRRAVLFCLADVGKVGWMRDLFAAPALRASASVLIFDDRRASRRNIEMHTAAMSM
jgi:hypothetical protein